MRAAGPDPPPGVARWSPHRPESKSRPAAFLDHFLPRTRPSSTQPPLCAPPEPHLHTTSLLSPATFENLGLKSIIGFYFVVMS